MTHKPASSELAVQRKPTEVEIQARLGAQLRAAVRARSAIAEMALRDLAPVFNHFGIKVKKVKGGGWTLAAKGYPPLTLNERGEIRADDDPVVTS